VYKVVSTQVDPAEAVQVELREVFDQARQGDLEALSRLRELLDDRPELWQPYGDVAKHAVSYQLWLVPTFTGKHELITPGNKVPGRSLDRTERHGEGRTGLAGRPIDRAEAAALVELEASQEAEARTDLIGIAEFRVRDRPELGGPSRQR
jgi:hypothetical protein